MINHNRWQHYGVMIFMMKNAIAIVHTVLKTTAFVPFIVACMPCCMIMWLVYVMFDSLFAL